MSVQQSKIEPRLTGDRIGEGLIFAQLAAVTIFQKIAVPIGGTQLFLGLFIMLGTIVVGVLSGRLEVRPKILCVYLVMVTVLAATQLFGYYDFSVLSLILLLYLAALYIFRVKADMLSPDYEIRLFQKIVFFLACLGVVQFLSQFVIGPDLAFPLDGEALKPYMMQFFNSKNQLSYGSSILKPNAVFLLEPAMLSKVISVSLIIEIVYFKRLIRIACLFVAQAFTFSGTGLIILFLLLPFYLLQKRQFLILVVFFVFIGTSPYWAPFVGLERTVDRLHEFSQPGTSGYARFVSIFPIIRDYIAPNVDTLLLGHGAGYSSSINSFYDFEVHPPSWGKLWIEYGLIGMIAYLSFLLPAIWSGPRSAYLKMALTILIIYDNYILIPTAHGLILALLAWPSANAPRGVSAPLQAESASEEEA